VDDDIVSGLPDVHVEAVDRQRSKFLSEDQYVLGSFDVVRENSEQGSEEVERTVRYEVPAEAYEGSRLISEAIRMPSG